MDFLKNRKDKMNRYTHIQREREMNTEMKIKTSMTKFHLMMPSNALINKSKKIILHCIIYPEKTINNN